MSSHLQSANMISLCCDIWSKKGLTSSYLGVTAHFFSRSDQQQHTVTLAVRRLTTAHTAAAIRDCVDTILTEWDVDSSKICAILTDNGSNMLAAFKEKVSMEIEDDTNIDILDDMTDVALVDEEQEFLDCEDDHDLEFGSLNRISCFSHTLQLVVSKFNMVQKFHELMKRTHSLVRKVNSSTKATERLISLCGKSSLRTVQQGGVLHF